jgi:hypothetical protein
LEKSFNEMFELASEKIIFHLCRNKSKRN